jgi:hypothetical protein
MMLCRAQCMTKRLLNLFKNMHSYYFFLGHSGSIDFHSLLESLCRDIVENLVFLSHV